MIRAALILIFGMALVPLGDSAGKMLVDRHDVSPFFVAWSRAALGAVVLLAVVLVPVATGVRPDWRRLWDWRIGLRGLLFTGGILCILTALRTEPLPNVFGAFFVGPLFSYVLSARLLGEPVGGVRSFLIALGFAGVLLVARPGFGMTTGLALAVLAGMFYGAFLTSSRWLARAAPPRHLLLSQLVVGGVVLAPLGIAFWPVMTPAVAGLALGSAAASAMANMALILAYGMAPATRLAPFVYFQLVAATIYGWTLFGDWPDALTLAGLVVLIGSGAGSLWLRRA